MEWLQTIDQQVLDQVGTLHQTWLDPIMKSLSRCGDTEVMLAIIFTAALCFFRFDHRRSAFALVVVALASFLTGTALKQAVKRERPDVSWRLLDRPESLSFPSGHAISSMSVFPVLGWLLGRRWGLALGALLALGIAASRVYVGVHYPLDVIVGMIAGALIAALTLRWVVGPPEDRP